MVTEAASRNMMIDTLDKPDRALLAFSEALAESDYRFVTITPDSHQRIFKRKGRCSATSLTDIFGWCLSFEPGALPADVREHLRLSDMLDEADGLHRSRIRASTVNGHIFLHSAFPTSAEDAVFLGPDSYRFANLIADELRTQPPPSGARIVDIGVGAGVGAITAATCCPSARIVATDINPRALRFSRINAAAARIAIETIQTSGLDGVGGTFDVALLNPPFIVDRERRTYRHGGAMHGGQLSVDLARAALARLAERGRLILYTGSAIVDGADGLKRALADVAEEHGCSMRYREIDPDVFGEELDGPHYADVDRIALVSAIFTRDR